MNCPCLFIVQLSSHEESLQLTIPPVTTFPERESLLHIFSIYEIIFSSDVVMVADSHFDFSTSEQNFSGFPNAMSCLAIFFQRLQQPLFLIFALPVGACSWSPYIVLSVQLPFVMKTRSLSVSFISSFLPATTHSIVFAVFFFPSMSNITFVTSVLNLNETPAFSRYLSIGIISDSY